MPLLDVHGERVSIGDCFWVEMSNKTISCGKLSHIYGLEENDWGLEALGLVMPQMSMNWTFSPGEFQRYAHKVTCTDCPNVFECLTQGVVKDAATG